MSKLSQNRRTPSQDRSRTRVDAILNATADIIREKGTAGLKIHELAERADVTPSSIYQYFRNKREIINALDERYVDATTDMVAECLVGIQSLEEGLNALLEMLDKYYDWYQAEPVISDIWYGMAADKVAQDLDLKNTHKSADVVIAALSPYVEEKDLANLNSYALLLTHLTGATIRLCLMDDAEEGRRLFNTFKLIIRAATDSLLTAR